MEQPVYETVGVHTNDTFNPKDFSSHAEWYSHHKFVPLTEIIQKQGLSPLDGDVPVTRVRWALFTAARIKAETVLDLGCNDGMTSICIAAKRGAACVGVDLSHEAIGLANGFAQKYGLPCRFIQGDIIERCTQLKKMGLSFDMVTCFEVIEHVEDPKAIYDAIDSVVNPGGSVLFTTPDYDGYYGKRNNDPLHVRIYTHKTDHEAPDAVSFPLEVGADRVKEVLVADHLIMLRYQVGSK